MAKLQEYMTAGNVVSGGLETPKPAYAGDALESWLAAQPVPSHVTNRHRSFASASCDVFEISLGWE
ncbi:MAG TPA: hypothetical protein VGU69_13790, partial [Rhizomicrobium sp.]|nr:hypothetical protein [Rhizomicrobium sp.]